MLSLIKNSKLDYPGISNAYSPSVSYPEYSFGVLSKERNPVFDTIRQLFCQLRLDYANYDTPHWNPLGEFIKEGSKVFVLCNFVYHRRSRESHLDFLAKCTHGSVVRGAVDYILRAVGPAGRVFVGNAPLQSCIWENVMRDTGVRPVIQFYKERGLPVEECDLRLLVAERSDLGAIGHIEQLDEKDCVAVDLGPNSLLADVDNEKPRYRVLDYDPKRTEANHQDGHHVYLINKKILDSDVIFSIPKLKTHEKVGITCAIKGCVGIVGHKHCLAHHRPGSCDKGGDEYQKDTLGLRGALSKCHEIVQRTPLQSAHGRYLRFVDRIVRSLFRPLLAGSGGAWWGNDTCWRMAVDLARIATYADSLGNMQDRPQRNHLSIVDGVIGGEGEGPLAPTPVGSKALLFGDNITSVDRAAAVMMGYDPSVIPIVRNAGSLDKYPLVGWSLQEEEVVVNGQETNLEKFESDVKYKFRPPRGWRDHL